MGENNALSRDFNSQPLRASFVLLPRELYDAYLHFYRLARTASQRAQETVADADHKHAMSTGRKYFNNMPDETIFIQRIEKFYDRLKNHTASFYGIRYTANLNNHPEEYIALRGEQATGFYDLLLEGNRLFVDTVNSVWKTDYLKAFTQLKQSGLPYEGATCLQEIIDMGFHVYTIQRLTEDLIENGRVTPEWKKLINRP
tara:strand:- start:159722 stop:160321 length:600 start_codon:yes stop_codon:yes gene_type:complete